MTVAPTTPTPGAADGGGAVLAVEDDELTDGAGDDALMIEAAK